MAASSLFRKLPVLPFDEAYSMPSTSQTGLWKEHRAIHKPTNPVKFEDIPTWQEDHTEQNDHTVTRQMTSPFAVNPKFNQKLSIWTGDITKLSIGGIVNAANTGL